MSDLISRSALLEEIKSLSIVLNGKQIFSDDAKGTVLRIINEQPNAYSVDDVISQLGDYGNEEIEYYQGTPYENCIRECVSKAIEIVKQGGVSDDACEWKTNDNQHMFAMWETECGTQTMIQKLPSYKYCPYCGKKIKVVVE